jgi:hypothetical protein
VFSLKRQSQSPLTILGFRGWRVEKPRVRIHEITKSKTPKRQKVLLGSQPLLNASGFSILALSKTRGRGSLFQNSRSHETRYSCGGGCCQIFWRFGISGFSGLKR